MFAHLLTTLAAHLTIWAVCFAIAVVVLERVAGARKRGVKVLVGLVVAHLGAVLVAAFGIGVIDIETEASLLARLLAGWVFVLGVGTLLFEVLLPRINLTLSRIICDRRSPSAPSGMFLNRRSR